MDKAGAGQVPGPVQDILYLTAVFNSCVNPFIYGASYYNEARNRQVGAPVYSETCLAKKSRERALTKFVVTCLFGIIECVV